MKNKLETDPSPIGPTLGCSIAHSLYMELTIINIEAMNIM